MRLILYDASTNRIGPRILSSMGMANARKPNECYASMDALIERLRKPVGGDTVAILCPSGSDDLNRLLAIRPLLRDMRIILILPDGRSETISEGHSLRPRFVGFADGDFSDVAAVLQKMTAHEARTAMAGA